MLQNLAKFPQESCKIDVKIPEEMVLTFTVFCTWFTFNLRPSFFPFHCLFMTSNSSRDSNAWHDATAAESHFSFHSILTINLYPLFLSIFSVSISSYSSSLLNHNHHHHHLLLHHLVNNIQHHHYRVCVANDSCCGRFVMIFLNLFLNLFFLF